MGSNFLKNMLGSGAVGDGGYYFGDATQPSVADVVIVSAPWSVTADFGRGATYTPDAVIDASLGKELYDASTGISVKGRVATVEIDYNIQELSEYLGRDAERITSQRIGLESMVGEYATRKIAHINEGFEQMQQSLYAQTKHWSEQGKRVALLGGDHSVSLGAVKALSERYDGLGVLFIDAHADFADKHNGYNYSHRTIARDIVEEVASVSSLVQVGVRDISGEECRAIERNAKVSLFLAETIAHRRFEGESWGSICREMVAKLPAKVYISLDIDALKIEFCNNTNAPVPGGMTFDEVVFLVNCVAESGREIVGFDITEVVSNIEDKMDAIVAARLLAKMCVAAIKSSEAKK